MRIRKRQVPFPLLPVTSSDPNLINRSPVMVQLNDATNSSCTHGSPTAPSPLLGRPQPSDQALPPIGKPINGSDESPGEGGRQHHKQESLVEDVGREDERGQKGNDTRKGSLSSSETLLELFSSSSPLKQDGNWYEGEKAFPLKKRRGRIENVTEDNNNDDVDNDKDDKKKYKMKTRRMKKKMNKKCSRRDDSEEAEAEEEEEEEEEKVENEDEVTRETKPQVNVGKKRIRGGALMEGSRCSRVNGRGWRCCQQTLVGYSLCEHHLGKGRLRSMTSVRNKSIGTSVQKNNNMPQSKTLISQTKSGCLTDDDTLSNDAESEEKKPLVVTKKRMKLGMVKARSISSLLGQTNTEIVAMAEDNSDNNKERN